MSETNNYRRPRKTAKKKVASIGIALVLLTGTVAAGIPAANAQETGLSAAVTAAVTKGLPYWATASDKSVVTDKFQGSIEDLYVSPEDDAELRAIGVKIDWVKSREVTNTYNEANNTSIILLVVEYDMDEFNASEFGPVIDTEAVVPSHDGLNFGRGLSLATSDYNSGFRVSVNAPELADAPSHVKYQAFTGHAGTVAEQYYSELSSTTVDGVKAYFAANAYPIVETFDGGLPSNSGNHSDLDGSEFSEFHKGDHLDGYPQTPERQADLKATGLRVINADKAVDITKRKDAVFNFRVVGTGVLAEQVEQAKNSGNPEYVVAPTNMTLTSNIEVHVVSSRKMERNAHLGEANAFTMESGWGKAFVTPTTTAPSQNSYWGYNFSNPGTPIVPVDPSLVKRKAFAGNLNQLEIVAADDGVGIKVENRWSSDFYNSSTTAKTIKGEVDTDTTKEEARLESDRNNLTELETRKSELTVALADAQKAYDVAWADGASEVELSRLQARIDNRTSDLEGVQFLIPDYEQRVIRSEAALELAKDRPSDTYTFTYSYTGSDSGSEGPLAWSIQGAEATVGTTWTSSVDGIDANFTVQRNDTGELVVEMKLSEVPTKVTEVNGVPSLGTGINVGGSAATYIAPAYEPNYFEITADVPTPEVPEVPTPEVPELPPVEVEVPPATPEVPELPPVEVEVPPTTETVTEVIPSDSDSDSFTRDALSDSGIDGIKDNKGLLAGLGAFAGLLMAGATVMFRRIRIKTQD